MEVNIYIGFWTLKLRLEHAFYELDSLQECKENFFKKKKVE